MLDYIQSLIPLQLFGDGGDGGSSGEGGAASASGDNGSTATADDSDIPAFIPERAKKNYRKAQEIVARRSNPEAATANSTKQGDSASHTNDDPETVNDTSAPTAPSFRDVINDEKNKEEREKYLNEVFSDRFSKYKSMETEHKQMKELLSMFGGKYGLDPASKTFMTDLRTNVDADRDFFATYAEEHGIPEEHAREAALMKAKIAGFEREKTEREEAAARAERVEALKASAKATKAEFPEFDLDKELSNPEFVKKCASFGGDTTSAYKIVHWDELFNRAQKNAAERAKEALSQSISSGQSRPSENGLNKNAAATPTTPDFSNMNSRQLREYFFKHLGK